MNGPVVSTMVVYSDFLVYKSGIYEVSDYASKLKGMHAVKIIGWNFDEKTRREYWIV
jgi:cathepsin B